MKHRKHILGWLTLLALVLCFPAWAELEPAPEGSFTVAVIPDTQHYLGRGTKAEPESDAEVTNPKFGMLVRWIADNADRQRIVFATHVGDIVDRNNHDQWRVARQHMDVLHGTVPYGISVGNHDMSGGGDSSLFQEYFGAARFESFDWYGGFFPGMDGSPEISGDNANSYQLLTVEGIELLFLHLECNAPDDVLAWASGVLNSYRDRHVFVTTHMWLGPLDRPETSAGFIEDPKGRMRWHKRHGNRGNTPQEMWEELISRHSNSFAVQAGDQSRTQSIRMSTQAQGGNTVHEMMFDHGGGEVIRLLRVFPADNRIEAITYDIGKGERFAGTERVPDVAQWQFTLKHDFESLAEQSR